MLSYIFMELITDKGRTMPPEDLKATIQAAAPQGKIPCAAAFKLAEELGLSRSELGQLLNELRIKIINCQLGCF
jgi:hypothetical protein